MKKYLAKASEAEARAIFEFLQKRFAKKSGVSRGNDLSDDEQKFADENFGMSYAEFDAMIARSRASGGHIPIDEVFAKLRKKYQRKLQNV